MTTRTVLGGLRSPDKKLASGGEGEPRNNGKSQTVPHYVAAKADTRAYFLLKGTYVSEEPCPRVQQKYIIVVLSSDLVTQFGLGFQSMAELLGGSCGSQSTPSVPELTQREKSASSNTLDE